MLQADRRHPRRSSRGAPPCPGGTLDVHERAQRMRAMKRLQVGDTVQDFTLPTSMGKPVALSEARRSGPVVLAWYLFDFGRV